MSLNTPGGSALRRTTDFKAKGREAVPNVDCMERFGVDHRVS